MAKFRKDASPQKQAESVAKALHRGGHIASVRTLSNYQQRLEQIATNLPKYGISGEIRHLDEAQMQSYLEQRSHSVGQKTLDMERQAMQAMARHVTEVIDTKDTLNVVQADEPQELTGRAYTPEQVEIVAEHQSDRYALATEIAYDAGLRASELYTLAPVEERAADERPALESKFEGREGVRYTVEGKGGLVREVVISHELAERLEDRRLDEPKQETDRGVHYEQRYDLGAGQKWSNSFSGASNRGLGWSTGAHGVRHSYAQERMEELQNAGHSNESAKETVSQELGHFRSDITDTYLR